MTMHVPWKWLCVHWKWLWVACKWTCMHMLPFCTKDQVMIYFIADHISISMYVRYSILVQHFEPKGRRFTNFHYYYYMHVPFAFCTQDQVINLNAHAFCRLLLSGTCTFLVLPYSGNVCNCWEYPCLFNHVCFVLECCYYPTDAYWNWSKGCTFSNQTMKMKWRTRINHS